VGGLFGLDKQLEYVRNCPSLPKHLDYPGLNNILAYDAASLGALTYFSVCIGISLLPLCYLDNHVHNHVKQYDIECTPF